MPTYEYVCKSCSETIEVFQPFSDKPLKKHKVCGGQLQKVFHARGIVFKGGGFYATDGKTSAMAKKTSDSESSSDSKKSDSKKSDSKSSGKSSAKAGATTSSSSSSDGD